jgi:tetratricopeptide (TPR) repeat protein
MGFMNIFKKASSSSDEKQLSTLIKDYMVDRHVQQSINKAKSFASLGQHEEAKREYISALELLHKIMPNSLTVLPNNYLLEAEIYQEMGAYSEAIQSLKVVLKDHLSAFDKTGIYFIEGTIDKLSKLKESLEETPSVSNMSVTKIYLCPNCKRLISFLSDKCPFCSSIPKEKNTLFEGMLLSDTNFLLPTLINISRRIKNGDNPNNFIANISDFVKNMERNKEVIDIFIDLITENYKKPFQNMSELFKCSNCDQIIQRNISVCGKCNNPINLSLSSRLLLCLDNMQYFFQYRAQINDDPALIQFIGYLVFIFNQLFFKQEIPVISIRNHMLNLLKQLKVIEYINKACVYDLKDISEIKAYVIAGNIPDEETAINVVDFRQDIQELVSMLLSKETVL